MWRQAVSSVLAISCCGIDSWIVGLAGPVALLVSFPRRGLEAGALLATVFLGLAVGVGA